MELVSFTIFIERKLNIVFDVEYPRNAALILLITSLNALISILVRISSLQATRF
jgi:hypothetical protein